MFKKILQPFYAIYAVVTFFIGLLINLPFFVAISMGDVGQAYRKGAEFCYGNIQKFY